MIRLSLMISSCVVLVGTALPTFAQEIDYFAIEVPSIDGAYDEDQVISREAIPNNAWYQMDSDWRVVVDAGSEAYIVPQQNPAPNFDGARIVGQKPRGAAIEGNLYALLRSHQDNQKSVLVRRPFSVAAKAPVAISKTEFLTVRGRYYERMWAEQHAGSALWRHLAVTSLKEAGLTVENVGPRWPMRPDSGVDSTFQLMSGGRAVSENLQLDRQLPVSLTDSSTDALVDLNMVTGITIPEVNWLQRIGGAQVELDPLAAYVPHDQYAVLLPSFNATVKLIDEGQELAKPLVQWFESQSRATDALGFYQRQMGLSLNFASRQLGSALVDEVAITGSDPYFRTGTDVAILMQSKQPAVLFKAITAQIAASATQFNDASKIAESIDGTEVVYWKTPDRHLSSFVAQLPNAVVVSNSLAQLRCVVQASLKQRSALSDLGEYKFFRHRYRRDPNNEKGLVIITDAAIRRWCGPVWRIAAARRTRARAEIAEQTVQHMEKILSGKLPTSQAIGPSTNLPSIGALYLNSRGVHSETFGTLNFQTPIAELDMKKATKSEVRLYEEWRNQYQRMWRNVFDPIAIEIELKGERVAVDLSVIPLIMNSSYESIIESIGNERLKNERPTQHPEAILSSSVAIDTNSQPLAFWRSMLSDREGVNMLSWIDGEISWHVDYDQPWFDRQSAVSPWKLGGEPLLRDFPLAVFVPSRDNLRMAAFVIGLRVWVDRLIPNLLTWEDVNEDGLQFVVGKFKEGLLGSLELPQIYYTTLPTGFALSTNERVFHRMLKNRSDKQAKESDEATLKMDPTAQYEVRMTGRGFAWDVWRGWNSGMRQNSRVAWSNIPVLNYLRMRYPDQDPAATYLRLFGEQITEPADGDYQWNDQMETYESSHYGHHLAPKAGPALVFDLQPDDVARAAISFQDGGLRARMQLDRKGKDDE